ncbi:receptor-type tyrosine-protein phosphatase V-like isoform X2 [Ascaphus truei]|uniref:receptor-type tyrosine-protein phosphatase V-like isoform X2 n=1 Tax=Ascaphus truei TaxID=8439 RepID=UPI003F5A2E00
MALRKFHRPISVSSFRQTFEQKQSNKNSGFLQEFEELKDVGNDQPKVEAELLANRAKNRYPHILPLSLLSDDHSRVMLTVTDGDPNSGYINANYIPGFRGDREYIASQAPTPSSLLDFWRMIWEQQVKIIVMLTVCEEHGEILCDQYWPLDSASYGPLTVRCVSELPSNHWTMRHFTLHHVGTPQVRAVSQLHYTAWPDRGIPHSPMSLVTFVELVREQVEAAKDYGPMVVHCSAGVGRSGTLIALDMALQQLSAVRSVDIFSTVHEMRLCRYLMLQTAVTGSYDCAGSPVTAQSTRSPQ